MNLIKKNKGDLAMFVADNIAEINGGINAFKTAIKADPDISWDETDVKNYLRDKLFAEKGTLGKQLLDEFEASGFSSASIETIANKYIFYKIDLEGYLRKEAFDSVFDNADDHLVTEVVKAIEASSSVDEKKKKFINSALTKIVKKALTIIKQNGFSNNISNVESGVQTANAGDSAQFLFIARAILAGFNCSNVDVRSSRYDAIIDYRGLLYKVQVKGVSDSTVSFKDRDRGGRGIDTHNERNKGKRITSSDCDIYVAVDKQIGICYIIPMKTYVDKLNDSEINSVSVTKLEKFKENWGVIEEIYQTDDRRSDTGTALKQSITSFAGNMKTEN